MRYIIVESFSSFHFAKEKFKKQNICWITSSPKLCNFFFLKKLNFIEIGCGTGSNGLFVSRKHNYTGIDISSKIINKGKKKYTNIKNFFPFISYR